MGPVVLRNVLIFFLLTFIKHSEGQSLDASNAVQLPQVPKLDLPTHGLEEVSQAFSNAAKSSFSKIPGSDFRNIAQLPQAPKLDLPTHGFEEMSEAFNNAAKSSFSKIPGSDWAKLPSVSTIESSGALGNVTEVSSFIKNLEENFSICKNNSTCSTKPLDQFQDCLTHATCLNRFNLPMKMFHQNDTCYNGLGCFSNSYPWHSLTRPAKTPEPPEKVCTSAILFTPRVSNLSLHIFPKFSKKWKQYMDPNLNTSILCHGFLSSPKDPWMGEMARAIIARHPKNVIIVDWAKGADGTYFDYPKAIGNLRVTAAVVTRLITHLTEKGLVRPERIHLIGHSLGAHTMALVAKNFKGRINHLTGLDPAGPGFTGQPDEVRMVANDAKFTDAIHTNVGGEGVIASAAHCDFYFNVGFIQPACVIPSKENLLFFSCAHQASHMYYLSAIKNRNCFLGRPTTIESVSIAVANTMTLGKLIDKFNSTRCSQDGVECVPIGLDTIKYKDTCLKEKSEGFLSNALPEYAGNYLAYTEDEYPYCLNW